MLTAMGPEYPEPTPKHLLSTTMLTSQRGTGTAHIQSPAPLDFTCELSHALRPSSRVTLSECFRGDYSSPVPKIGESNLLPFLPPQSHLFTSL